MKLYHTTSANNVPQILTEGLKPRGSGLTSPWYTNAPGHEKLVYLSHYDKIKFDFYGVRSAMNRDFSEYAVLEIDLADDETNLRADENFIYRSTRGPVPLDKYKNYVNIINSDKRWKESVSLTGLCSHVGSISPNKISVVDTKFVDESMWYRPDFFDEKLTKDRRNILFDILIHHTNHEREFSTMDDKMYFFQNAVVLEDVIKDYVKMVKKDTQREYVI